jgi:hypothetical protein
LRHRDRTACMRQCLSYASTSKGVYVSQQERWLSGEGRSPGNCVDRVVGVWEIKYCVKRDGVAQAAAPKKPSCLGINIEMTVSQYAAVHPYWCDLPFNKFQIPPGSAVTYSILRTLLLCLQAWRLTSKQHTPGAAALLCHKKKPVYTGCSSSLQLRRSKLSTWVGDCGAMSAVAGMLVGSQQRLRTHAGRRL